MERRVFKQPRIALGRVAIDHLCDVAGKTPSTDLYVVPIDPTAMVAPGNATVVDLKQHHYIVQLWQVKRDRSEYMAQVAEFREEHIGAKNVKRKLAV
jgi:hypothetical protein